MEIEQQYEKMARCNRCGFCQTACPIFRATGHEAGVARGRLALLRALVEKRIPWNEELKEPLFACLLCGACTANCFPALPTADLIRDARGQYLERVGRNKLHRLLFTRLLPFPRRLRWAARAVAFAKNRGLSTLANALGLLRIFGRDFARAEKIVQRFPPKAFRDQGLPRVVEGEGALRIGYFVGCGTDIMCPETAAAVVQVLRQVGRTVEVLENCCCGLPPITYGDRQAAQALAEQNLKLMEAGGFDVIVADCSSCASFLKKYLELFDEGDPRRQAAANLAARVRDLVELLPQCGPQEGHGVEGRGSCRAEEPGLAGASPSQTGKEPGSAGASPSKTGDPGRSPGQGERLVATYHDPCHASRGQGLVRQPREFLRSLPGIEYRELPEADWCCGGAGSYAVSHYELASRVLDRKMDNLQRTGANLLVTSCPACIIQLRHGIHRRGLPVRVCHIAEMVAGE